MEERQCPQRTVIIRKKRIIHALKESSIPPAEIAIKADVSVGDLADIAKEYLGIADSDVSAESVFTQMKEAAAKPPQDIQAEPRQETPEKEEGNTRENTPASPKERPANEFSLVARGRIVAMLKSTTRSPREIADQAGISIETLADWTRACMGLIDEGQPPVEIFWLFRKCDPLAQPRRKTHNKQIRMQPIELNEKDGRYRAQLCWSCVNAVPGVNCGCSWSESFTPVEGWQAEECNDSYRIIDCPLFKLG